ncbi:hypothetical protein CRYUN_Cryun20dG0095600 [Craigia yunnanensis]
MSVMAVFSNGYSLHPSKPVPNSFHRRPPKQPGYFSVPSFIVFSDDARAKQLSAFLFFRQSTFRIRSFQHEDGENIGAAEPIDKLDKGGRAADEVHENQNGGTAGGGSSFLAKLAIALGVAAALTVILFGLKGASFGSFLGVQCLAEGSSSSLWIPLLVLLSKLLDTDLYFQNMHQDMPF